MKMKSVHARDARRYTAVDPAAGRYFRFPSANKTLENLRKILKFIEKREKEHMSFRKKQRQQPKLSGRMFSRAYI